MKPSDSILHAVEDAPGEPAAKGAPVTGSEDSRTRTAVQVKRQWAAEDESAKEAWGPELREAFKLDPRRLEGITKIVGVEPQQLSRLCDAREHSAPNLFDLARIARARPKVFARILKGLGDVLGNAHDLAVTSIDAALRHVMAELGAAAHAYEEAMRNDGRIDTDERAVMLAKIAAVEKAVAAFRASVERTK